MPTGALAHETIAPDEAAVTAEFITFLQDVSRKRYPTGLMRRFNQPRHAGCVEAEFIVPEGLADHLRVGLFARPGSYAAFIRFASASSVSDRERDIRGMSIRVQGVEGENLTPAATTQDFVLNSHPVMVAANSAEFLELLRALEAGGLAAATFFLTHPRAAVIGFRARQHPSCHLDIPYWSTTPSLFGPGRAVKYVVKPSSSHISPRPPTLTDTYLHDAMKAHLSQTDASFEFMVQFQTDAGRMPIDDATVEWSERESPYVPVARIRIPTQDIDAPQRDASCEQVAFNPWHSLPEHRPLGSMNRARRNIYAAMAQFRHERNAPAGT
jgi:hypothetical protein